MNEELKAWLITGGAFLALCIWAWKVTENVRDGWPTLLSVIAIGSTTFLAIMFAWYFFYGRGASR
ncbi:MAG TPA: hypothetical protein VHM91_25825 [Verrucomicrobiales bacterium]|jgi:hypothetical protein|nr:hypothetical protein [Verrucomicrobiales bacterium]